MTIENITDTLTSFLHNTLKVGGVFVGHRSIIPNKTMPILKELSVQIWYVKGNLKKEIITCKKVGRISSDEEQIEWDKLLILTLENVYNWLYNGEYKNLGNE